MVCSYEEIIGPSCLLHRGKSSIGCGLPNHKADLWHGLIAPKGVPAEIVAKLNAALRNPDVVATLAKDDVTPGGGTS